MKKALLAVLLAFSMTFTGCSTAWVTTLDSILAAAAPALVNILQIVALSTGKPMNSQLATKIDGDAAAVKQDAADFANASAAAAPGACSQLQAALDVYEQDLPSVLAVAQVSNPATQNKIATISALVVGVFSSIAPLIPNCQAPSAAILTARARLTTAAPPLALKNFVSSYNTVLVEKTGDASVDAATPNMKLHYHSKAVRVLTLGIAK